MWKKTVIQTGAAVLALTVSASLAGVAEAAPRPPQPKPAYVALGDSYAAGTGAGSYITTDGTSCHRSLLSYAGRIAANSNLALNLQACAGAVTSDVTALQLGPLSSSTAYVTVTIGGNDIGFADILSTCLGTSEISCLAAVSLAESKATNELPAKLVSVFSAVKAKAGNAKIVATNYPRLFNGVDCSLLTSFTSEEMTRLNAGADTLSGVIRDAATASNIGYVDVRTPFVGHAVCSSAAWINNASLFTQFESFHPNADGQRYGYTPGVSSALGTTNTKPGKGASSVTTGGQTSTDTRRGEVRVSTARG
ncbi:MAG: SGNH/GDSL hydrolase family protein [Micropruina sp.]